MVQTHDDPLAAEELQGHSEAEMALPPLCDPIIHQWATHEGPYIPPQTRLLLDILGAYCLDPRVGKCDPSENTLSRHLGDVDRSAVSRLLHKLEASGHIEIEPVPADNGYERNVYLLTGVRTGWDITTSKVRLSQEDVYELQRENAELRRRLAELEAASSRRDEISAHDSSSREGENSPSTTDRYVTRNLSRTPTAQPEESVDEEAERIEAALQDRWHVMGQDWRGGFPPAVAWFTLLGRCRKRDCQACRRYRTAENPHREDFWRQWRNAELEAARPPGEENTVGDAVPRCVSCNQAKNLNESGLCGTCAASQEAIDRMRKKE